MEKHYLSPVDVTNIDIGTDCSCPCCGSARVDSEEVAQSFEYGADEDAVTLNATVMAHTCTDCGLEFLDDSAEDARTEAVCRHLGLLTPREIQSIRGSLGMSRAAFSKLTGIGTASLSRWETGQSLQSPGYDRYLRLLSQPLVMQRAKELSDRLTPDEARSLSCHPKFRTFDSAVAGRLRCSNFQLRKVG